MEIVLASHNKNKIAELQSLMNTVSADCEVISLSEIGFHEEIIEDGDTFEANALIKSRKGAELGYITVADDSGLMVDALGGAPGVYSARYAGEVCDNAANNEKLLKELSVFPSNERTARFVSVVTCSFPDGREDIVVRGECPGMIISEYRGSEGFGYDPLFLYEPMGKTFAEMTPKEKNSVSHRGMAMNKFAKEFAKIKF